MIKPHVPKNYKSSWAQYSLLARDKKQRKDVINNLSKNEIPANIFYSIPLHLQKVFKNLKYIKGSFPVAEEISNKIFSIPMHPYLNKNDQNRIIEQLNNYNI